MNELVSHPPSAGKEEGHPSAAEDEEERHSAEESTSHLGAGRRGGDSREIVAVTNR